MESPLALPSNDAPLLSICVPTYNRATWLRCTLPFIVPQIKASHGLAELIVSDNASDDDTAQIVEEASKLGPIRYSRNSSNIGGNPNMYKCVSELAHGKFIYVIGDDDFLRDGFVNEILAIIQKHPDLEYIYLNYAHLYVDSAPDEAVTQKYLEELGVMENLGSKDTSIHFVSQIADLIAADENCFTPLYCSIFSRIHAAEALKMNIEEEPFSTVESILPHALYIAKTLLHKPAYYVGYPYVITSSASSWVDYRAIYTLNYLPAIYDNLEQQGIPKSILDKHRLKLLQTVTTMNYANRMLSEELPMRHKFSYKKFIYDNLKVHGGQYSVIKVLSHHPVFNFFWKSKPVSFFQHRLYLKATANRQTT